MYEVIAEADGRVRLCPAFGGGSREWPSLADLAAEYVAFINLPSEAQDSADWDAWECVEGLTDSPAWAGAVDLIDSLLAAADEHAVGMIAAGPLHDLMTDADEAPRFIDAIEDRARHDPRWASAVAGVWLHDDAGMDVNRRLARFGAHYPDGTSPLE